MSLSARGSRVRRCRQAPFWSSGWHARALPSHAARRRGQSGRSGRFRALRRRRQGWRPRRRSSPGCGRIGASGGDADRRQEPRGAPGGAGDRGRAERGIEVIGELELAWRAIPNRFIARDRHQRQDDHRRAARPHLPRRRASRWRSPATSARRCPRWRPRSIRRRPSSARHRASSSRTASPLRPSAPSSSTSRRTTSTATPASRPTLRRSCGSSPTRATTTSPSTTRDEPAPRGTSTSADALAASPSATAAGDNCEVTLAEGTIFHEGEPLLARRRARLAGAHNVANAMAAAAAALSMGVDRDAVREGLRSFAGVPHRLERVGRDRRRSLRQRLEGDQRRLGHGRPARLRAAGSRDPRRQREGRAICGSCRSGSRELCRLLPDRSVRRQAGRGAGAQSIEAGVPLHRCDGLEDAVRRAAAAARPGEVVLLSPACASFDAFENFERRGERFREIVEGLR